MADRSPRILFGFVALQMSLHGLTRPLNCGEKLALVTSFLKNGFELDDTMRHAVLEYVEVAPAFHKEAAQAFGASLRQCLSNNDRSSIDEWAKITQASGRFEWQDRADLR